MRIAHCIRALIAVLGLAAVVHPVTSNEYFNDTYYEFHRFRRSPRRKHFQEDRPLQNMMGFDSKLIQNRNFKKNHHESESILSNETIDCCPMIEEMVEPMGGSNQDGLYVELYRDENYRQRFYELSCDLNVLDKPCKFIQKKLHHLSRCVQKHSYTYALVKDTPSHRTKNYPLFPTHDSSGATYTLDYIKVRSGCSCEVMSSHNVKKNNKKKRRKAHHKT
ncbi:uncharacterized protein [Leptinotarsa decemlineata]|uniref:uncharacterized protein n=1 Tax=Leptinotarsa decemlineata TaxID=7539 RepID=UPI000C253EB5|nr:uncharacterized protein LOC111517492 [Leptinotarsa decemlineata]